MCHFVTLIVPTDEVAAVREIMRRHERDAKPIDNPSVRAVLHDGEHQYLTTPGHCDCGTVLAPRHETPETFEDTLAKKRARMKRRGWSDAKIARALDDLRKNDARPNAGGSDSLELWHAALRDLRDQLKLPYAGLLVRFYSGAIATEAFRTSRRDIPRGEPWQDALASLEHDQVTIFR